MATHIVSPSIKILKQVLIYAMGNIGINLENILYMPPYCQKEKTWSSELFNSLDLNLKVEYGTEEGYLHNWQKEHIPLITKEYKPIVNQGDDSSKKNYTKQNIHMQHLI